MAKKLTIEEVIEKCRETKGERDVDLSMIKDYNGSSSFGVFVCNKHNVVYRQSFSNFWSNHNGCSECNKETRREHLSLSKEEFVKKANSVHNKKYDYSKVDYVNARTNVCIICPDHGEFWQMPSKHLEGHGCLKCANRLKKTTDDFINQTKNIHGDTYDFSKVNYVNNKTNIIVICRKHGDFLITPHNLLKGMGCQYCSGKRLSFKDFVNRANEEHEGKYIYDSFTYENTTKKIKITCPKHGEFWQRVSDHLDGNGCPICSNGASKDEQEIVKFIEDSTKLKCISRCRDILENKEIDIYLPEIKLGIEYYGNYWHSEKFQKDKNYHLNKLNECNEKGIRLIQIFEDEWKERNEIVKSKILYSIGSCKYKEKVYARKCSVNEIDNEVAELFLNENHIQGFARSTVYLGAFNDDKLVGVMSFLKEKEGYWNLTRFACDNTKLCVGVGGKLFIFFVKKYNPNEVKSFADRRWTTSPYDNLYTKLDFKLTDILKPDYRYFYPKEYGIKRVHKFNFRKNILNGKYGFPLTMTESEMCDKIGAYKIYDCGLFKYVWKNN